MRQGRYDYSKAFADIVAERDRYQVALLQVLILIESRVARYWIDDEIERKIRVALSSQEEE